MKKIFSTKSSHYLFIAIVLQISCAPKAPFIWVEDLPTETSQKTPAYRIHPGDQVEVAVWDQAQLSGTHTVREDGFITIPLVGELKVAGTTPTEAAEAIKAKLEGGIVQDVRIVVISRATTPEYVTVIGEVQTPGQMVLKPKDSIVDLLAAAGGLTQFADKDSIYVLRQNASPSRVRFDYDRLTSCTRCGIHFKLQDGDVIIVE